MAGLHYILVCVISQVICVHLTITIIVGGWAREWRGGQDACGAGRGCEGARRGSFG